LVFSSVAFLFLFLPVAIASHFAFHPRLRDPLLLIISACFYLAGDPNTWWVLLVSLCLNYAAGLALSRVSGFARQAALLSALVANLGMLVIFKYASFIAQDVIGLEAGVSIGAMRLDGIVLPLGISFFTFHGISYIVDVYRGTSLAQPDPVRFGIYMLFFPQLIAGPIVRYHVVADQLERRNPRCGDLYEGFVRFTIGLAKKMLIANPLGSVADAMFALPSGEVDTVAAWLGAIAYAFQIYFDFSGYSDMAIGLARCFGVRLPENFDFPYVSQSITEFWRRWHISLSQWFRDYVYIPLGGNRHGDVRTYANLITVFILCGLWHGASWNFLAWGAYFGFFLVLERVAPALIGALPQAVRRGYVCLVVVVGWVLFRATDITHAVELLSVMFNPTFQAGRVWALYHLETGTLVTLAAAAIGSTPFPARLARALYAMPLPAREWFAASAVLLGFVVSVSFVVASSYNPFIYFRF
jgi:alginate O-acetyltransferase complex protein AlgI